MVLTARPQKGGKHRIGSGTICSSPLFVQSADCHPQSGPVVRRAGKLLQHSRPSSESYLQPCPSTSFPLAQLNSRSTAASLCSAQRQLIMSLASTQLYVFLVSY